LCSLRKFDKACNKDQEVTVDEYIENIEVVAAGMSLRILTHAEKENDEEIVRSFREIEGSGKVRNCPAEMATKSF